jgi:hypothetical protein
MLFTFDTWWKFTRGEQEIMQLGFVPNDNFGNAMYIFLPIVNGALWVIASALLRNAVRLGWRM